MHFVDGVHVVKDNLFPTPPLFRLIQEQSGTDWKEMYKVFNMGHRMEVYTSADKAEEVMDVSRAFNIEARVVGRVEASDTNRLTIKSEHGVFEY